MPKKNKQFVSPRVTLAPLTGKEGLTVAPKHAKAAHHAAAAHHHAMAAKALGSGKKSRKKRRKKGKSKSTAAGQHGARHASFI